EQGKRFRAMGRSKSGTSEARATAASIPQVSPGVPRYKILVSRSGIYRLDYAYLQTEAPDLLGLDPGTLMLTAEGVEVPISIRDMSGGSGELDGHFDQGDFLEFYGKMKTEPPTVEDPNLSTRFPGI